MKIDKEAFDKLSQLDRIEFRQKLEKCDSDFSIMDTIWYTMIVCSIFLVNGYTDIANSLFVVIAYAFILQIIFMFIICPVITKHRKEKLCEEYFETVIKKKDSK